jgi:hypothetical protein
MPHLLSPGHSILAAAALLIAGCAAVLPPGASVADASVPVDRVSRYQDPMEARPPRTPEETPLAFVPQGMQTISPLGDQVEFDHRCPAKQVRLIRANAWGDNADLDVCGVVRRYRRLGQGSWVDVTASFPASALPAPLDSPAR